MQMKKEVNLFISVLISIFSGLVVIGAVYLITKLIKAGWSYFPQF